MDTMVLFRDKKLQMTFNYTLGFCGRLVEEIDIVRGLRSTISLR